MYENAPYEDQSSQFPCLKIDARSTSLIQSYWKGRHHKLQLQACDQDHLIPTSICRLLSNLAACNMFCGQGYDAAVGRECGVHEDPR